MTPKGKVEAHKLRIHEEFVRQKNFLAEEEQRQLQKVEEEEREQLKALGATEARLAQQSQALQELIAELERRSRGPMLELLQVRPEDSPPLHPESQGEVEKSQRELPLWLSGLRTRHTVSVRVQVRVHFLASLGGLRIQSCCALQCRLQMQLGSGVARAVA